MKVKKKETDKQELDYARPGETCSEFGTVS